jgi:putative ABC transport system permease protein
MALPRGVARLFRLTGREVPVEQDIDAEIQFHLEQETAGLLARGLSTEAARAEARRRFGDLGRARRDLVRIDRSRRSKERRVSKLEDFSQDLGYALRGFRRQPGFAAVIILTLGLGIGANATMFGLLDQLLLKPPTYVVAPDRIVRLQISESEPGMGSWTNESMAWLTFRDQRDHASYYADIAAYFTQMDMPLGRGAEATKVRGVLATASYFKLLGVTPVLGRLYNDSEDRPGAALPLTVLSWQYWQGAYGGAREVIGKRLQLGSQLYTVIGVMPKGFNGVDLNAVALWVPFHAGASDVVGKSGEWRETYNWQWLKVLARLKPGVTRARASDEAQRIQRAAVARIPEVDHAARTALVPLSGFERGAVSHSRERVTLWLASVALVVLLIVCANVANLLLARAARRRREIAVRLALGVGKGRLLRQLLTESLVLALGGGALGLLLARWGGDLLRSTLLPDVRFVAGTLDWRIVAVTALATLLTGILTGLVPALHSSRPALTAALKSGGEGGSPRSRLRTGLLAAQACFSVILLVGAGLFVRSLWRVVHTDIGYDARNVLIADADLGLAGYDRPAAIAFFDQALARLRVLPGIERAGLGINAPFWTMNSTRFRLSDRDSTPRHPQGGPYYNGVTPDYFATLGMRLVRGRGFTAADQPGTAQVMVINQHLADFYWPRQDPLGKCVKVGEDSLPCASVIGVVANARVNEIQESPRAMYYLSLAQSGIRGLSRDRMLFLRTRGAPLAMIPLVRKVFHEMAANLPAPNIRTFQSQIDPEIQPWRLGAVMFGLFGGLALLVAAIGLYSVMSYSVAQRTHEFGIRSALGASSRRLVRSVLRDGLRVVLAGMALGLGVALAGGRFLAPLLYHTSPRDPVIFGAVTLILLLAAICAMLVPARRATRVDPLEALRTE